MAASNNTKLLIPNLAGFYGAMEPITYAIIRIVFGWIMIMHGWPKWGRGVEAVGNAFVNNYGVPRSSPRLRFSLKSLAAQH